MEKINSRQYRRLVEQIDGYSVVLFSAAYCSKCHDLAPELDDWSEETRVPCYEVDGFDCPAIAGERNITKVPTTILCRGGEEIQRWAGLFLPSMMDQYVEK